MIRDVWQKPRSVTTKRNHTDLVTAADREAEAAIARVIAQQAGPDHEILSEEAFYGGGEDLAAAAERLAACPHAWVVDPLDGTTNFVYGIPFFNVSIAYLSYGRVEAALVYDPLHDEWFEAVRGRGAWLNGRPLRVAPIERLEESLLATAFPWDEQRRRRRNLEPFAALASRCRNVRVLGSAALALAYVASGRLTGFWEVHAWPWDVAAGSLLVTEAGGRITDLHGGPFSIYGKSLAASNGAIHDALVAALRER